MSASVSETPAAPLIYTVRQSARAIRVTLKVVPGVGLVVSVPRRFARRDIPAVVEEHRGWAESALAELEAATPAACRVWPPEVLELAALDRCVSIVWAPPGSTGVASVSWLAPDQLQVTAAADDRALVATLIADALRHEGQRLLAPRLAELAELHGFSYKRISIRGQRSVWGSCSSSGTISLNWKLLFLAPELVDYVLLHELVHTRHLDHSQAFWSLLESLDPEARRRDRALIGAARLVPPWFELVRRGRNKAAASARR